MLARRLLVGAGAAAMLFGIALVLTTQRFDQLLSLAVWFAAAIVLHDGVIAPATTVTTRVLGVAGRRVGDRSLAVVRIAWATGACLTLLAVPLIVAQARGPRNASVLPGDYARDLLLLWAAIAAITLLAVAVGWRRPRRTSSRTTSIDR